MFARHKSTIGSKFHFYVSRFKFGKSAFLPARRSKCKHGICYGDVAGWLAGCLSVTRRYCIKTDKPVLKLFRPSGSPIILVSYDPLHRYPIPRVSKGPSAGQGIKYTWGVKNWRFSCDFRQKLPFI